MTELFISYAREDQGFVRHLYEALEARGRTAWIDWKDIPPTAEWMAAIDAGIEGADNFLFVLSPDSVQSDVCRREVGHAVAHNKRIMPLLRRPVDGLGVPDAVARVNWIPARAEDDFDTALETLLAAVDTDLDWVHAHTRLTTRAVEWQQEDHDRSYLLRGSDLEEAESWLSASVAHQPPATALQIDYVLAGRQDVTRRQRQTIGVLVVVLLVVVGLGAIAYSQYVTAEHRNRVNLARRLATEAEVVVSRQRPQLRLLEAAEAVMVSRRAGDPVEPSAMNALLGALTGIGGTGMAGHQGPVTALAISPDSRWAATGGQDGSIRLWDLGGCETGMRAVPIADRLGTVTQLAFTADSQWLVSSDSGVTRLFRAEPPGSTPNPVGLAEHAGGAVIALDETGHWLATGGEGGLVHAYDLQANGYSTPTLVFGPFDSAIATLTFNPDGRWLLVETASGSPPVLQKMETGGAEPVAAILKTPPVSDTAPLDLQNVAFLVNVHEQAAFTPPCPASEEGCEQWLVTIDPAFRPILWDLAASDPAADPIVLAGHNPPFSAIISVAFSHDGRWLVTAGMDRTFRLWDMATVRQNPTVYVYDQHQSGVAAIAFDEEGHLMTAGTDGTLYRWDLSGPTPPAAPMAIYSGAGGLQALSVSHPRGWLVGMGPEMAMAWDLSGASRGSSGDLLAGFDEPLRAMAISPDGAALVISGTDGTARCWSLSTLQSVAAPVDYQTSLVDITGFALTPQAGKAIVTSLGGISLLSVANSGALGHEMRLPDALAAYGPVEVSSNGRWLSAVSQSGSALLWDLEALPGPVATELSADGTAPVTALAFNAAGTQLVAGSSDGHIELWDLTQPELAEPVRTSTAATAAVRSLAYALDDSVVYAAHEGGGLRRWDLSSPDTSVMLSTRPDRQVERLLTAPDGRSVFVVYDDTAVEQWSADRPGATGPVRTYAYQYHLLGDVEISPDGHWLALGTQTGQVRLWSLGSGDAAGEPMLLPGHEGAIVDLLFDEAGERLFTASWDGTVRLWDIASPDPAREPWIIPAALDGNPRPIGGIAWDSRRAQLIVGASDGTVRVWPLDIDRLIDLSCAAAGRNLSAAEWSRISNDPAPPATCPGKP